MARRALEQLAGALRESPGALPAALGMVVLLVWAADDGGFDPLHWLPGTLFLLAVIVVTAVAAQGPLPGGRLGLAAILCLAGYVAWSYLSITWAGVQGDAWSGANKTLAFFVVYLLFALRPVTPRVAAMLLGAYSVCVSAIGVATLLTITRAARPVDSFVEGRLAEPTLYPNANCALFIGAVFPALYLATRREVPAYARGVFLAAAGVSAELGVLCQSRASLAAIPFVAVVYLALVPGRLRSLLGLAAITVVTFVSTPSLLDVYEAVVAASGVRDAVVEARSAVFLSLAVLLVVGVAWAVVDRAVVVPQRVGRALGSAAVVAAVVATVVAGGLFVQRHGDPIERTATWWDRFKANEYVYEPGTPHLISGFGSSRYEIWRVAVNAFRADPILGQGADNFAVTYLRERRSRQDPRYPHSIELRFLQETGIVGTALGLGFLAAAAAAAWRARRGASAFARGFVGAALALVAYWLVHGSVDWLWEIPALSGIAFAALGLAVATGAERLRAGRKLQMVAAIVLAAVGVAVLSPQWLAAREVDTALATWRADPEAALDRLEHARGLNPLTDEPDVLAGVISGERGQVARQKRYFQRALVRNPSNWYPRMELAAIAAREGDAATSRRWLDSAFRLNPLDLALAFVRERIDEGKPPTQTEIDDFLISQADYVTGRKQS